MNDENTTADFTTWDLENTHPDLLPALEDGLCEIIDPELGLNILQLGLIRNVSIQEDEALVTMILTTPYCPYGPSMMESTRAKAEMVLGFPTRITYGQEAWNPSMMEDGLADDWGLL